MFLSYVQKGYFSRTALICICGLVPALSLLGCSSRRPSAAKQTQTPGAAVPAPPPALVPRPPPNPPVDPPADPSPTRSPEREASARSLAALREGLGSPAQAQGARHFPYYMHVVAGYVVLWHQPPEEWAVGKPSTLQTRIEEREDGRSTAFRRVRMERLPQALRTLPGTNLQLLDHRGLVCEARVEELLMLGQAITSSFGHWEEQGDMGDFKMPTTRPEIAKAIWKIGAEMKRLGHSLGARVKPLSGSCDKATWARVAIGPPPQIVVAAKADASWARPAIEQFKRQLATPEIKKEIGRYREEGAGWSLTAENLRWEDVAVWGFPPAPPLGRLLSVSVDYGDSDCSEGYEIRMLWKVNGTPEQARFQLLAKEISSPSGLLEVAPRAVVDIDDDGQPEVLVKGGLVSAAQKDLMFLALATPDDGCGAYDDRSLAHD